MNQPPEKPETPANPEAKNATAQLLEELKNAPPGGFNLGGAWPFVDGKPHFTERTE